MPVMLEVGIAVMPRRLAVNPFGVVQHGWPVIVTDNRWPMVMPLDRRVIVAMRMSGSYDHARYPYAYVHIDIGFRGDGEQAGCQYQPYHQQFFHG